MKDEIKEKFKEKHKKEIEEINNQFEELIKDDEIKEISQNSDFFHRFLHIFPEKSQLKNDLLDYITRLQEENKLNTEERKYFMKVYSKAKADSIYKERIDKANKILGQILVVRDWEHKGRFRPVKNTTRQEVYATIVMLNELLETPNRTSYGLLQGDDKE